MNITNFLSGNEEDPNLNQYWYSSATISRIVEDIETFPSDAKIAFLSTPSLYFSLSPDRRSNSFVFDYDEKWKDDRGFVFYDFNKELELPSTLLKSFDLIVIDPPFITSEVWQKYSVSAKALMKSSDSKVMLTTIFENAAQLRELLNVTPTKFQPSIPNLVYQYNLYTNYESTVFSTPNPEIPE